MKTPVPRWSLILLCFSTAIALGGGLFESFVLVDPASPASAPARTTYVSSWTKWNHVRTTASLAAAALLTVAPPLLP